MNSILNSLEASFPRLSTSLRGLATCAAGCLITFWSLNLFAYTKGVQFEAAGLCYDVRFDQPTSSVFSCQFPTKLTYKIRNCSSSKLVENGENTAELTCPDDQRWKMRFRTSTGIVSLNLKVRRETAGKLGVVSNYIVDQASVTPNNQPEAPSDTNNI